MTFGSVTMLRRAVRACQNKLAIATDCSFKRTQAGYPILTIGTVSATGKYRLIAVSLVCREASFSYKHAFEHVCSALKNILSYDFKPSFIMGDANPAIDAALLAFSSDDKACMRLVCYAHFMKAVRNQVRYKCGGSKVDWLDIRKMLRTLGYARSERQFRYFLTCFKHEMRNRFS